MSETPQSSASPVIIGSISPDEARLLHDAEIGSPDSMAVLSRLGASALEGGPAFAVVVDEDNNPTHFVDVTDHDLGTAVRSENLSINGLPEPSEAYAELIKKQHDAEKSEKGGEAQSPLDQITENPDVLMQPGNLRRALVDPASLVTPENQSDTEIQGKVGNAQYFAAHEIAGPEAAAMVSADLVKDIVEYTMEQMTTADRILQGLDERLGRSSRVSESIAEQIPTVKRAMGILRDTLDNPKHATSDDILRANRVLMDFVTEYDDTRRKSDDGTRQALDDGRRLRMITGETSETVHGMSGKQASLTEEARFSPNVKPVDEVIAAVETRGKTTIAEHKHAAEEDVQKDQDEADGLAQATGEIEEDASLLFRYLVQAESDSPYPRSQQITVSVDDVKRYMLKVAGGEQMFVRTAAEVLDELQRAVSKVEVAVQDDQQIHKTMRRSAQVMKTKLTGLRSKER